MTGAFHAAGPDQPRLLRLLADPARAPWILALATCLCLAPFLTRAFNIDEPLFVWTAAQIRAHPLDPYGFKVNWTVAPAPMWTVTKNPPLASYYLAAAATFLGWSEFSLHLAFLLPAVAVILGTYYLARSMCRQPVLAAVATLATPVFLVSSATVMCDVMMLAFWVWAVWCWWAGLERRRQGLLAVAALLVAAGALTKYFGVCLIPLLVVYTFARARGWDRRVLWLLIPAAILIAYDLALRQLYGQSPFFAAGVYAKTIGKSPAIAWRFLGKPATALGYAGGCLILPSLLFPFVKPSWRMLLAMITVLLAGAAVMLFVVRPVYTMPPPLLPDASLIVHWMIFAVGGVTTLWLAVADLRNRRDSTSLLLFFWLLGTFAFAAVVNWTINGRSMLPLAPAAALLLVRRLDWIGNPDARPMRVSVLVPLVLSFLVSLLVTQADATLAETARTAARTIAPADRREPGTIWCDGNWGFELYMQLQGAPQVDSLHKEQLHVGDVIAIPWNNAEWFMPEYGWNHKMYESAGTVEIQPNPWLTTQSYRMLASFYASDIGPLPFVFGRIPPESYSLARVIAPATTGAK